jgi:hypothetical protein
MAERYNPELDLEQIGGWVGYPLYMKPFDGGMWVGVTRVSGPEELHAAYDASGERMMHLQASVEGYDVFTRSLSIGPQTRVMRYDPGAHGHYRYQLELGFLPPEQEREVALISRLVNAFFRWEFNSCETIVKDGRSHPIDYANASPDIALVSLHYHFPWAISSLVAWCAFCSVSGRSMRLNQRTKEYFLVGDDESASYEDKLARYAELTDAYYRTAEFEEFRAAVLPHLDELTVDYVESAEFDELVVTAIQLEVEPERQEEMIERCRSLTRQWAADERAAA